ncbi:hypothetical protein TRFO_19829 [Tritrichomonas foetus]|uniref:Uncharacterized protein n=1 Tax=Tritrichomonas foetus TaxID=1144522 RepID=A0A1J4KH93_9EUKA|nr:hypothetical protein TRFO_19829 [Tritrichomonas foetus]|eukprot:OHT10775.1 hypothetical protein TRFO_19829 [Tritrichomonas foetus]
MSKNPQKLTFSFKRSHDDKYYFLMEKKKSKQRRVPTDVELPILKQGAIEYYSHPNHSDERKTVNEKYFNILNPLDPVHWSNETVVRMWFQNNANKVKLFQAELGYPTSDNPITLPPTNNQIPNSTNIQKTYPNYETPADEPPMPVNEISNQSNFMNLQNEILQQPQNEFFQQQQNIYQPTPPLLNPATNPESQTPVLPLNPAPAPERGDSISCFFAPSDSGDIHLFTPPASRSTSVFSDFDILNPSSQTPDIIETNDSNLSRGINENSNNISNSVQYQGNLKSSDSSSQELKRVLSLPPDDDPTILKSSSRKVEFIDADFSSSASNSGVVSRVSSVVGDDNTDDDNLPIVPQLSSLKNIDSTTFDTTKYQMYAALQDFNKALRFAKSYTRQELLEFQQRAEKRMIEILTIFNDVLKIDQIYSVDTTAETIHSIETPTMKRQISITTRQYNDEIPESTESTATTDFIEEVCPNIYVTKNWKAPIRAPEPIKSFYKGMYKKENYKFEEVQNLILSTIIEETDSVVKVFYNSNERAYQIEYQGKVANTGFFHKPTSICAYPSENLVFVCGDIRIKSFSLETLENIETYFVRTDFIINSAIAAFDNTLILGLDKKVLFWNIHREKPNPKPATLLSSRNSIYEESARRNLLDIESVNWIKGKTSRKEFEIDDFGNISNIVIHQNRMENNKNKTNNNDMNEENKEDILIAISSNNYPIIYVYNTKMEIVSRLISHTMNISSISFYGNKLVSGSYDFTAKIWDIEKGFSSICLSRHSSEITAICGGKYCGRDILFTGGKDSEIKGWSISDKKAIFKIKLRQDTFPVCLRFNPEKVLLTIVSMSMKDDEEADHGFGVGNNFQQGQIQTYKFD